MKILYANFKFLITLQQKSSSFVNFLNEMTTWKQNLTLRDEIWIFSLADESRANFWPKMMIFEPKPLFEPQNPDFDPQNPDFDGFFIMGFSMPFIMGFDQKMTLKPA